MTTCAECGGSITDPNDVAVDGDHFFHEACLAEALERERLADEEGDES